MAELDPGVRIRRQAIVVIHGIGEQRPMDTLRGFADAILGARSKKGQPLYYSKPDRLSDGFELRRLRAHGSRPATDLYEFYWAHRMPVASWGRLVEWTRLLLWRPRGDVPPKVARLWLAGWATAIAFGSVLLLSVLFLVAPGRAPIWWPSNALSVPIGLAVAIGAIEYFLLSYVGDAAVYLSASPRNVAARNEIRGAGIELIDRLHQGDDYDRIVVAGHSLGSVIGYDIICHAWQRRNALHGRPESPNGEAMSEAERAAVALEAASRADDPAGLDEARRAWWWATRSLWRQQRRVGLPWLVTDFVTMGCPLAHADILMASDRGTFETRKLDRELPTCPPVLEVGRLSYPDNYETKAGHRRTARVLHHGAPFAVTRWTNLYFPGSGLLRGDFVGGPLAPILGAGIEDVPVRTAAWRGFLSHTFYWRLDRRDAGRDDAPVARLLAALDLDADGPLGRGERDRTPEPPGSA